jgi:hypothetical protein
LSEETGGPRKDVPNDINGTHRLSWYESGREADEKPPPVPLKTVYEQPWRETRSSPNLALPPEQSHPLPEIPKIENRNVTSAKEDNPSEPEFKQKSGRPRSLHRLSIFRKPVSTFSLSDAARFERLRC